MSPGGVVLRVLVTTILLALVVGAGACGVCGGLVIANMPKGSVAEGAALVCFGLLAIAILCLAIRALWRPRRQQDSAPHPPEQ